MNSRFPSAAFLVLLLVGAACTHRHAEADVGVSTSPTPSPAAVDGRERLLELGRAWLRTPADVTYRTVGRVPGQPVTAHLCLRQMFNGDVNRTKLLRTCSRRGRLVLTWHPPKRWRTDVTTPVERFIVESSPSHSEICHRSNGPRRACRRISRGEAMKASGFEFLFQAPEQILDEIGAMDVTTTEAGEALQHAPVECFAATGPEVHVEWCYSPEGTLLSFLRGSGASGWESIEAATVS